MIINLQGIKTQTENMTNSVSQERRQKVVTNIGGKKLNILSVRQNWTFVRSNHPSIYFITMNFYLRRKNRRSLDEKEPPEKRTKGRHKSRSKSRSR